MTGFRVQWLQTWPLGVMDVALHAAAAWWLPGPWWLQYLPDAVVPLLWLRSMQTNLMADEGSALLRLHRLLHVKRFHTGFCLWWCAGLMAGWLLDINIFVLPLHVAVHMAIDATTHGEGWQ